MCGIFGFSKLTPTTRVMAPFLAYAMQERGTDSWGMTNGTEVVRKLGPILSGFYIPDTWDRGIFHTRAASVGEVTVENAHPFTVESVERRVIGIHNGHISNYSSLNINHSRECTVDSQHLFHHIHGNLSMDDIYGWGAVAWYDTDDFEHLHLVKFNMDDLHIALLASGEVAFASTRTAVVKAAQIARATISSFYTLESGKRYRLNAVDGLTVGPAMPFGTRHQTYSGGNSRSYGYTGGDWRNDAYNRASSRGSYYPGADAWTSTSTSGLTSNGRFNPDNLDCNARSKGLCAKCKTAGTNRRTKLVCDNCYSRFQNDLEKMDAMDTLYYVRGEWKSAADFLGLTDEQVEEDVSVGEAIQTIGLEAGTDPWEDDPDAPTEAELTEGEWGRLELLGEYGRSGGHRFVR